MALPMMIVFGFAFSKFKVNRSEAVCYVILFINLIYYLYRLFSYFFLDIPFFEVIPFANT